MKVVILIYCYFFSETEDTYPVEETGKILINASLFPLEWIFSFKNMMSEKTLPVIIY